MSETCKSYLVRVVCSEGKLLAERRVELPGDPDAVVKALSDGMSKKYALAMKKLIDGEGIGVQA